MDPAPASNVKQNAVIIGYDLRIPLEGLPGLWSGERIATYLVRSDLPFALSVDTNVWPKALTDCIYEHEWGVLNGRELWNDYEVLLSTASRETKKEDKNRVICITLENAYFQQYKNLFNGTEAEPHWKFEFNDLKPIPLDDTWTFLGYDIADAWLLSYLSNMGTGKSSFLSNPSKEKTLKRSSDHKRELRSLPSLNEAKTCFPLSNSGGKALNDFNLVSEYNDVPYAIECANTHAPEHAPFFPFGLFMKQEEAS